VVSPGKRNASKKPKPEKYSMKPRPCASAPSRYASSYVSPMWIERNAPTFWPSASERPALAASSRYASHSARNDCGYETRMNGTMSSPAHQRIVFSLTENGCQIGGCGSV
jgi:hypothetical protein